MGQFIQRLLPVFCNLRGRVLILGLDNAGKTTILHRMKLKESKATVPTVGFNVESISHKDLHIDVWDVGGQPKIR